MSGIPANDNPEAYASLFGLSPRQRRLRTTTAILLIAIVSMIVFAMWHPFFHLHPPAHMTPQIRNAIAVKALMVLGYWTICFCLVLAMLLVAWLDIREVRRRLAETRLEILRSIGSRQGPDKPPRGAP